MEQLDRIKVAMSKHVRKMIRVSPGMSETEARIKTILELKIVPQWGDQPFGKINQLCRLLKSAKYINKGKRFVYSIDEKCVPLLRGRVIDNMPIDYQKVVDFSLEDYTRNYRAAQGEIAKQNLQMINIVKEYIELFCNNKMEDKNRTYIHEIINNKADNLEEALQRILFWNQILWQTKHTLVGLGRLDRVLDRFPVPENGEDLLCDFLITLHSFYNFKSNNLLGDTGQIILLGGKEPNGEYFCNSYTRLFIKCLKKVSLPDPKILLRVSTNMPDDLMELAVECIATGIGSPLISNDEVIVPLMRQFGYSYEDAFNYGVSACWEPLSIGKSLEQNNIASIEFALALHQTVIDENFIECRNFEDVFELYHKHLDECIEAAFDRMNAIVWEYDPLLTLFIDGCLEKNLDISKGGAQYNNYGLLSVGISSAVDSLINIDRLCFQEKSVSLEMIQQSIKSDYQGFDDLKIILEKRENGFGTDSEQAIQFTNSILQAAIDKVMTYRNKFGGRAKFGLSSPSYLSLGQRTGATADGRNAYQPFATHISRDKGEALTEIVNFASKLHYEATDANANVIDIMIQPSLLISEKEKFVRFLDASIEEGIFQMQFNVVSYAQLVDAKAHPEKYPNLIVRVWGFSAYFNDLPEDYQNLLIHRAKEAERVA